MLDSLKFLFTYTYNGTRGGYRSERSKFYCRSAFSRLCEMRTLRLSLVPETAGIANLVPEMGPLYWPHAGPKYNQRLERRLRQA